MITEYILTLHEKDTELVEKCCVLMEKSECKEIDDETLFKSAISCLAEYLQNKNNI